MPPFLFLEADRASFAPAQWSYPQSLNHLFAAPRFTSSMRPSSRVTFRATLCDDPVKIFLQLLDTGFSRLL